MGVEGENADHHSPGFLESNILGQQATSLMTLKHLLICLRASSLSAFSLDILFLYYKNWVFEPILNVS